jgi:lysophospholipase L1-like esterase
MPLTGMQTEALRFPRRSSTLSLVALIGCGTFHPPGGDPVDGASTTEAVADGSTTMSAATAPPSEGTDATTTSTDPSAADSGSSSGDALGSTSTGSSADDSTGGEVGAIDLGDDGVLSIWTIGDSITEGVNNGYRNRLFTELTLAGYALDFVGSLVHPYPEVETCPDADHDGHAGYTIGGIHDEVTTWYASTGSPDVALLMAGTNDLAWWVASGTQMDDVAAQLVALTDEVLALDPELVVVVSTIPPMASMAVPVDEIDRAELVVGYNAALLEQLEAHPEFGTRLWHADVNGALQVADLYDGVHPTRAAHDQVADAWLAVLDPLLVPPR